MIWRSREIVRGGGVSALYYKWFFYTQSFGTFEPQRWTPGEKGSRILKPCVFPCVQSIPHHRPVDPHYWVTTGLCGEPPPPQAPHLHHLHRPDGEVSARSGEGGEAAGSRFVGISPLLDPLLVPPRFFSLLMAAKPPKKRFWSLFLRINPQHGSPNVLPRFWTKSGRYGGASKMLTTALPSESMSSPPLNIFPASI